MAAAGNLDWLFGLVGWVLIVTGALAVAWALFWDRARGRRRCPKCWYDMAGVPGLRCPECGQTACCESKLSKTRRRRRWAAVALISLLIGAAATRVPSTRRDGWIGAVPMSILVFIAPVDPDVISGSSWWRAFQILNSPTPPATPSSILGDEIWARLERKEFWDWQARVYLARWLRANPGDLPAGRVRVPSRWPIDRLMDVRVTTSATHFLTTEVRLADEEWTQALDPRDIISIPHPQKELHVSSIEVRLCAGRSVVYQQQLPITIQLRGASDNFIDPVASDGADRAVLAALAPRVIIADNLLVIEYHDRSEALEWQALDFGVYFDAELRSATGTIAFGQCATSWGRSSVGGGIRRVKLAGVLARDLVPPQPLELILHGDMGPAGAAYFDSFCEISRPATWAGTLIVPVQKIEHAVP